MWLIGKDNEQYKWTIPDYLLQYNPFYIVSVCLWMFCLLRNITMPSIILTSWCGDQFVFRWDTRWTINIMVRDHFQCISIDNYLLCKYLLFQFKKEIFFNLFFLRIMQSYSLIQHRISFSLLPTNHLFNQDMLISFFY